MEKYLPHLFSIFWIFGLFGLSRLLAFLFQTSSQTHTNLSRLEYGSNPKESPQSPWIRVKAKQQVYLAISVVFFFGLLALYPAVISFRVYSQQNIASRALAVVVTGVALLGLSFLFAWIKAEPENDGGQNGNS